ncbi:hypothetical protein BSK59_12970 [Paenibacillus odorifer]|uniref:hypothetical protein n=1 Tax=Paenibacillus odorifer TaxID=189426 RepID=UPI00096DE0D7|nr:hypothetical protein [Paenibacillus odorifer]OME55386.1 hypothetical protein BSK59_12970 [Paenibacillus odorifer]
MNNRLSLFLGCSTLFNGVRIYSPTIKEIESISEVQYQVYLSLATFNKEKILQVLLSIPQEEYDEIEYEDSFEILTENSELVRHISEAISFFLKTDVVYDEKSKTFFVKQDDEYLSFLNIDNYTEFAEALLIANGSENDKKPPLKFKNKRSEIMFKEMAKLRKKNNERKTDTIELKDILSILCNYKGNGINIFNVHQLTIYQTYEHFERLGLQYQRDALLPVWANGYLKEGTKLPEIIIKTKL